MQQYTVPQNRFYPMQPQYPSPADYIPPSEPAHTVPDGYSPSFGYDVQWPCYYSYADPDYASWTANNPNYEVASTELPLYAPVPVNGPAYPSVLTTAEDDAPSTSYPPSYSGSESDAENLESKSAEPTEEENPLDIYLDAPQVLFPTPSELLTDLNTRSEVSARAEAQPSEKSPTVSSSGSSSSSALGKRKREAREKPENLNQRKAYFRSVSDNVGFTITDPDTITSHDKKRSYLECLEEYVQWLHEQIRLVGHEPIALERISTYRGLKNSSLRTMLVHMQNTIRNRNAQKLQAEKRFMDLQNALLMRTAAEESLQFRRHSIAIGASIPPNVMPNFT
ncbi:hypothetical protein GSI_06312 [Ganoderma sinense ZZ0214-1]|uniref:Uncharacterized protein n=1 Tax=Ganoderma sinense ZZ0214-1 TaxID=1077348 RepID=A0A2G8SCX3_9APHY|nr:hypothetical protein GSI_06312 [Ganoderma sinense ZZ0214-1]